MCRHGDTGTPLLLNVLSYYCYSQFIRLIMCSEISHFHWAVISITIKYDCKHFGRSRASATGEDRERSQVKEATRSLQFSRPCLQYNWAHNSGNRGLRTKHCQSQENGTKKKTRHLLLLTLGRSYTYATQKLPLKCLQNWRGGRGVPWWKCSKHHGGL